MNAALVVAAVWIGIPGAGLAATVVWSKLRRRRALVALLRADVSKFEARRRREYERRLQTVGEIWDKLPDVARAKWAADFVQWDAEVEAEAES